VNKRTTPGMRAPSPAECLACGTGDVASPESTVGSTQTEGAQDEQPAVDHKELADLWHDDGAAPAAAPPDAPHLHPPIDEQMHKQGGSRCKHAGSDTSKESEDPGDGDCASSNFRDVSTLNAKAQRTIRPGRLFRCSQFHTPELRKRLKIACILDLRRTAVRSCERPARKAKEMVHPEWAIQRIKNKATSDAPRCPNCEAHLNADAEGNGVAVRQARHCCLVGCVQWRLRLEHRADMFLACCGRVQHRL
jgi:Tyrosine phosphatase family